MQPLSPDSPMFYHRRVMGNIYTSSPLQTRQYDPYSRPFIPEPKAPLSDGHSPVAQRAAVVPISMSSGPRRELKETEAGRNLVSAFSTVKRDFDLVNKALLNSGDSITKNLPPQVLERGHVETKKIGAALGQIAEEVCTSVKVPHFMNTKAGEISVAFAHFRRDAFLLSRVIDEIIAETAPQKTMAWSAREWVAIDRLSRELCVTLFASSSETAKILAPFSQRQASPSPASPQAPPRSAGAGPQITVHAGPQITVHAAASPAAARRPMLAVAHASSPAASPMAPRRGPAGSLLAAPQTTYKTQSGFQLPVPSPLVLRRDRKE
jgi:hypothetical protein